MMKDQQILGHSCSYSGSLRHFKGKKRNGKTQTHNQTREAVNQANPCNPKVPFSCSQDYHLLPIQNQQVLSAIYDHCYLYGGTGVPGARQPRPDESQPLP